MQKDQKEKENKYMRENKNVSNNTTMDPESIFNKRYAHRPNRTMEGGMQRKAWGRNYKRTERCMDFQEKAQKGYNPGKHSHWIEQHPRYQDRDTQYRDRPDRRIRHMGSRRVSTKELIHQKWHLERRMRHLEMRLCALNRQLNHRMARRARVSMNSYGVD